jgi:hypothetical protein
MSIHPLAADLAKDRGGLGEPLGPEFRILIGLLGRIPA